MDLLFSHLGRLRIIGFLEGISFILLIGVGMPLKYFGGYPNATHDLGMAHGILFILYVISVFPVKMELKWPLSTSLLVWAAAFIPFGTFIAEYKLFSNYKVKPEQVKK